MDRGARGGLESYREGQFHDATGAATLRRGQRIGGRQDGGSRLVGPLARQHGASGGPVAQSRSQQSDSVDPGEQCGHGPVESGWPNTRLQLLPPKPKELLIT